MLRSSHFLVFGRFWQWIYENTKIVCNVYNLQGKMGKTEKNRKEITQLRWPKYQKPKDENMGLPVSTLNLQNWGHFRKDWSLIDTP